MKVIFIGERGPTREILLARRGHTKEISFMLKVTQEGIIYGRGELTN